MVLVSFLNTVTPLQLQRLLLASEFGDLLLQLSCKSTVTCFSQVSIWGWWGAAPFISSVVAGWHSSLGIHSHQLMTLSLSL